MPDEPLNRSLEMIQVAVAARRVDRLDALVDELKLGGASGVCAVRMDVCDETSIKAAVKMVRELVQTPCRRDKHIASVLHGMKGVGVISLQSLRQVAS